MNIRGHFTKYRQIYIHSGLGIFAIALIFFVVVQWLSYFTLHDESMRIPDFEGSHIDSLSAYTSANGLRMHVMDSVYDDHLPAGTIVKQDPPPQSYVKPRRKIYVSIVATSPEMVVMPNLKDLSIRQAIEVLEMNKLSIGHLKFVDGFDRNAVQFQLFNNDTILPGTELIKSSPITLVISRGMHNPLNPVPFLIGLNRRQALRALYSSGFNIGNIQPGIDKEDGLYRVFEQSPMYEKHSVLEPGSSISFSLCPENQMNFDSLILVYTIDSLSIDSLEYEIPE